MTLSHDQKISLLQRTVAIAELARAEGNHPFGALLADAKGDILIEAGNAYESEKGPGHAELIVARRAATLYSEHELAKATLVTSVEPCAMCSGAIYWAGIGAVVFGITERRLGELTGDNSENLTMDLPSHKVFSAGQRPTKLSGPFPELESVIVATHANFW